MLSRCLLILQNVALKLKIKQSNKATKVKNLDLYIH